MEFEIACATWIKEDDEKVLNILQNARTMPTMEELMEQTGLPEHKIRGTLNMLIKQIKHKAAREKFIETLK